MEIIENPATKSTNTTNQSNWLRSAISGAEEKMKAILSLCEENLKEEIQDRRKEAVTKEVQDLFASYCSLVEKYDRLKFVTTEISESWDDSQLETTDSDSESTNNSMCKDDVVFKRENARHNDVEKFRISKLVEDNTRLQVELIRRNNEKREIIKKLQNKVDKLVAEKDAIQRRLSYYESRRRDVGVISPKKKSILLDKIFKGCA